MEFIFATFSLLIAAGCCAPTGLQDAGADVRTGSLELNRIAVNVSAEARYRSEDVITSHIPLVWILAEDKCDPGSLRHNSVPCTQKISIALTSYKSVLEVVDRFPSCSQFVSKVKPVLHKLHNDMGRFMKLKGTELPMVNPTDHTGVKNTPEWEMGPLCTYTMERLFSFSIITARVFAVGDPAHHK